MTDRDWIHLGLSILGCIPVVGITANIANAVLYFQEGDALNGLLSVAGALIGVGGVTAAIGAAKGICALTTVGQAIKTAGVAYTAGASAMQTIEAASKTFNMLKENDFQWNEEILISAGQTALSLAGTIAGFKAVGSCINEAAALSASGLACFVAGTKVLTDKGFKNIEDIEEGDYVYSTSDETGESGYKEVLQVFQKETEVVTHVFYEVNDVDGEKTEIREIETTLNHLFWCEGEWKAAGTLKKGDLLTLADGSQVEVTEITYEDRHTTVYNMEVEDYHTYHVGEDGVWVHNTNMTCGVTSGGGTGESGEKAFVDGELFEAHIEKDGVGIDALAEVHVDGKRLVLKDIVIYTNSGDMPNEIGTKPFLKWLNSIKQQASNQGFEELQIIGQRVQNSTSANPGSIINRIMKLKGGG